MAAAAWAGHRRGWTGQPDGSSAHGAPRAAAPAGDLLGALVGADRGSGPGLTDAEIADEVATFPLAGHETSANALGDDEVGGVPIPAGSLVAIPPYLVHRHAEFWPDPAGFDPRRFLPGGPADPSIRHRYAFIPFGGGKRACIGASFAELETVLALATIARRFRLELTTAGIPWPAAHVTLRPAGGLRMRLHHR